MQVCVPNTAIFAMALCSICCSISFSLARLVTQTVTYQKSPKHLKIFPAASSFFGKLPTSPPDMETQSLLASPSIHINGMMQFRKKRLISDYLCSCICSPVTSLSLLSGKEIKGACCFLESCGKGALSVLSHREADVTSLH